MDKRQRICVIASTYPRSNDDVAVPWLREEVNQLVRAGYEVTVFAPAYKGQPSHEVDGVPVKRFRYFFAKKEDLTHDSGAPSKISSPSYLIISVFYLLCGTLSFTRFFRKGKFDVVHVHWPFPHANFLFFVKRTKPLGIVLNFHGAELALARKSGRMGRLVKKNLTARVKEADAVIVNSRHTAKEVESVVGPVPISIIPFGCPIPELVGEPPTPPTRPRILFVGRLIERKGVEYLIKAFAMLRETIDADLWIVGSGFLLEELKEKAKASGAEHSIQFLTNVSNEEIAEIYRSSTVFVLPAIVDSKGDTEGLGVVLIEAMTFGLPVVASDVGGIPDVVVNDVTGLLVPEKDPAALSEALSRIIVDSELRIRLKHGASEHIAGNFTWNAVVNKLSILYDRVVESESVPTLIKHQPPISSQ